MRDGRRGPGWYLSAYRAYGAALLGALTGTVLAMHAVATATLLPFRLAAFSFNFAPSLSADYRPDAGVVRAPPAAQVVAVVIDRASGQARVSVEQVEPVHPLRPLKVDVVDAARKDEALIQPALERPSGGFSFSQDTLPLLRTVSISTAPLGGLAAPPLGGPTPSRPGTPAPGRQPSEAGPRPLAPVAAHAPVAVALPGAGVTPAPPPPAGLAPTSIASPTPVLAASPPGTPPVPPPMGTAPAVGKGVELETPTPTPVEIATPEPSPMETASPAPTPPPSPAPTATPGPAATSAPTVVIPPVPVGLPPAPAPAPPPTATPTPMTLIISIDAPAVGFIGMSNMAPGDSVSRIVQVRNVGTLPFTTYTLSTSASGPISALWSDATHGLQMRLRRGTTVLYDGRIAVTGLDLGMSVGPGGVDTLEITVYLPATAGNHLQGLSQTIDFTWTATGG